MFHKERNNPTEVAIYIALLQGKEDCTLLSSHFLPLPVSLLPSSPSSPPPPPLSSSPYLILPLSHPSLFTLLLLSSSHLLLPLSHPPLFTLFLLSSLLSSPPPLLSPSPSSPPLLLPSSPPPSPLYPSPSPPISPSFPPLLYTSILCMCTNSYEDKVEHYRVRRDERSWVTVDDEEYFENLFKLVEVRSN